MYKINTTMEVIKEVFAITKDLGLDFLIIGSDSNQEPKIDEKNLIQKIFGTDLTNKFCRLVTGDYETNFDKLPFMEQEAIIINFFTDIKRLSLESRIIKAVIGNLIITETPSLTSAVSLDKTESIPIS